MFDVDAKGLAKILERRGKKFVLLELIQNALDEHGVTRVDVWVQPSDKSGYHWVTVTDDSPDGFKDLRHAYTLFAESAKKANAEQRGRWNLGEKLVIAMCRQATIETTTGTITFQNGEREVNKRRRTTRGSTFRGECRMTRDESFEAVEAAFSVLVPAGIVLHVNGIEMNAREPLDSKVATLQTEVSDADGFLRKTRRKTAVSIYPCRNGEEAMLYEMGIPVVPIDCRWNVDIAQKIPLNSDRDNVTPAYLREVLTIVVNLMHGELTTDDAASPWVGEALASSGIESEAVFSIMDRKHGENRVAFDPSDPEGSKIAVTKGYEVIHGGSYTKDQWDNIRRADAVLPAGKVTPSPKPFTNDGYSLKYIETWTAEHHAFADYAKAMANEILGARIEVAFTDDARWKFAAAYGPGSLTVSVRNNPRLWFKPDGLRSDLVGVDALLIHEFAHHRVRDHLSSDFHEECCRLGARLTRAIREGKLQ